MGYKMRFLLVGVLGATTYSYYNLHKDIFVATRAVEKTIADTNQNVLRVLNGSETLQQRVSDLEQQYKALQEQTKDHEATIINLTRRVKVAKRDQPTSQEQPQEQPQQQAPPQESAQEQSQQ
jgi:predicted  nucleic acid-binding Zn-ribbon protein